MKRSQLTSFFLEALLLVIVFVAMILVLTGVFGASHAQSKEAKFLTQAVTLAANAAEAVSAADDPAQAAKMLDEGGNVHLVDNEIEAFYITDGSAGKNGTGTLRMIVEFEQDTDDASLLKSTISIYDEEHDAVIYKLETAKYRKEAAE